jgi:hypothetical protein
MTGTSGITTAESLVLAIASNSSICSKPGLRLLHMTMNACRNLWRTTWPT